MGNLLVREEEVEPVPAVKFFDEDEEDHLLNLFDSEARSESFPSRIGCQHPELSAFGSRLLTGRLGDFPSFLALCTVLVRDTPLATLSVALEVLQKGGDSDTDGVGADLDERYLLSLLLLDVSQSVRVSAGLDPASASAGGAVDSNAASHQQHASDLARRVAAFISTRPGAGVCEVFPHAPALLQTHFHRALDLPYSASSRPFAVPHISCSGGMSAQEALVLSLHCPRLQGIWKQLYSTDVHGCDFVNLREACLGYEGGTVVVITARAGAGAGAGGKAAEGPQQGPPTPTVFGAYSSAGWKDDRQSYGTGAGGEGFVFVLQPHFAILQRGYSFQYLNTKSFDRSQHGMGLGCRSSGLTDRAAFAVFLPTSLEGCMGFGQPFQIEAVELFAVGDQQAVASGLAAQTQSRQAAQLARERARTVDRAAFFNSEFDRQMFLGRTFAHQGDVRNRDS